MSGVKVERRHRESAWLAVCGKAEPPARVLRWFDGDRVTYQPESTFGAVVSVAFALAQMEAGGYELCQRDVVKTARRFARNPGAELLGAFADDVEQGVHVGASDSKEKP